MPSLHQEHRQPTSSWGVSLQPGSRLKTVFPLMKQNRFAPFVSCASFRSVSGRGAERAVALPVLPRSCVPLQGGYGRERRGRQASLVVQRACWITPRTQGKTSGIKEQEGKGASWGERERRVWDHGVGFWRQGLKTTFHSKVAGVKHLPAFCSFHLCVRSKMVSVGRCGRGESPTHTARSEGKRTDTRRPPIDTPSPFLTRLFPSTN